MGKQDLYKYYRNFYKNKPENVKGDKYSIRGTINESNIPKYKRRYNSKGNVINEGVDTDVLIQGLPVNQKVKFNQALMVRAIEYGMVILINYAGDKDNWKGGRERVIYPMVMGVNRNTGNLLIRGWHLTGWSVKKKRNVDKEWRLFKSTNIKSMTFTGDFYRLIPKGYKINDRVMTERTVKYADFNEIRRNQESLVKSGKIANESEQMVGGDKPGRIVKIDVRITDTSFDLRNPYENINTTKFKRDNTNFKMTFLKNISKDEYIAIMGALGTVNRTVKLYEGKEFIGNYKVRKSVKGRDIKSLRNVDGKTEFFLYTFNEIIS